MSWCSKPPRELERSRIARTKRPQRRGHRRREVGRIGRGHRSVVADRITGKTVIRELMGPTGADAEPDDVAVGAVELLRASLMELHSPNPPRGEAEAPQVVRDLAVIKPNEPVPVPKARPARLSFAAGPAMDLGLGRFGASLHSNVAAWGWITKGAGVHAFASVPLATARFTVPEGSAEVSAALLGLGVTLDLRPPEKLWIPIVGAGVVAAHVVTLGRGTSREPTRRSRAGTAGDTVNWASRCAWPRRYAYASTPLR